MKKKSYWDEFSEFQNVEGYDDLIADAKQSTWKIYAVDICHGESVEDVAECIQRSFGQPVEEFLGIEDGDDVEKVIADSIKEGWISIYGKLAAFWVDGD